MVSYNCSLCNFLTILKGNYSQHLKCKKHLTNVEVSLSAMVMTTNDHKMTTNDHKMTTTISKTYGCDYCNESFSTCLLYTSPSPRDAHESRMPSSA